MNWKKLLKLEIESAYSTTAKLIDRVDMGSLGWKPATGENWMTMGQLLLHLGNGCGAAIKGFVTGDWGLPEGVKMEDLPPEEMLPPAEKLPAVKSVDEARKMLADDKALALRTLDRVTETDLATKKLAAPWAPKEKDVLGRHLLKMIQHLERHKGQLFYYLKLQGKPVATGDLWG